MEEEEAEAEEESTSRALPLRSRLSLCFVIGCAPPMALGRL